MNQFKGGTLIVAIATVIVAILILSTDRDSSNKIESVNLKNGESQTESNSNAVKTAQEEQKIITTEDQTDITLPPVAEKKIAAPDGPFDKDSGSEQVKEIPDEATNYVSNEVAKETSEMLTAVSLENANKQLEDKTIVSGNTKKMNSVISGNKPIWLEQNLGNFKSVNKGPVVINMMPNSARGLQGENPERVKTNKSDRFISFDIPADYNYQRMPLYNGGYYIAPMPSYLMPSVLPKSIEIDTK